MGNGMNKVRIVQFESHNLNPLDFVSIVRYSYIYTNIHTCCDISEGFAGTVCWKLSGFKRSPATRSPQHNTYRCHSWQSQKAFAGKKSIFMHFTHSDRFFFFVPVAYGIRLFAMGLPVMYRSANTPIRN